MNPSASQRQQWRTLSQLIEHIGPGMLTSLDTTGQLTSRPMTPLELDRNGVLWFFIRASSLPSALPVSPPGEAFHRTGAVHAVNIAFAQPDDAAYVSVSGTASLVRDPARVNALWSPVIRLWFAQGKEDPDLALLRVDITQADHWDARAAAMVRLLPAPPVRD